jgi:hypothetical protein
VEGTRPSAARRPSIILTPCKNSITNTSREQSSGNGRGTQTNFRQRGCCIIKEHVRIFILAAPRDQMDSWPNLVKDGSDCLHVCSLTNVVKLGKELSLHLPQCREVLRAEHI